MRKKVTLIFILLLIITSIITSTTFARSWDGYYPCTTCKAETWHVEACGRIQRLYIFDFDHRIEGTNEYCNVYAKYLKTDLKCITCGKLLGSDLGSHLHAYDHTNPICPYYGVRDVCPY